MDATVREVLTRKAHSADTEETVRTIPPDASVAEAVRRMNEHHIGSLLIVEEGRPVGILSERDVLTRIVEADRDARSTHVRDVMTPRPLTISLSCSVGDAMRLMTEKRVRHLPVVVRDQVVGVVSIGDLVWWLTEALESEVDQLHHYIHGPAGHCAH